MIKQLKKIIKKRKIFNYFYNICKSIYYYLYLHIYKNRLLNINKKLSSITIRSKYDTVNKLIHSNKSMGRFGDGDISMTFVYNNGINDAERHSNKLSQSLKKVLNNRNNNFIIGLPDQFRSLNNYNKGPRRYWLKFVNIYAEQFMALLDKDKVYYNTSVTRPYMDYRNKKDSGLIFYLMKKVWENKKVLIIEGYQSRVGFKDDLLDNTINVKRIECPVTNAFESYDLILHKALHFLGNHKNYITLISLGCTATILSWDLCNHGFRAIDLGNLDLEYQWYLNDANKKINLPYKYVLEIPGGDSALPIPKNSKYDKEIICKI